jgi:hypothetical protein
MTAKLPAKPDPDRALIGEVAMDIGKEAVSHLRIQYPAAFAALGPSGQLSLRNFVHNQIMAALDTVDADEIRRRLDERRAHRRKMHKLYDHIRGQG